MKVNLFTALLITIKWFALWIFLVGFNSAAIAHSTDQKQEPGSIRGEITDRISGEPLIGVNILIDGTSTGTTTDVSGHFRIDDLEPGIYTLRFSYVGYETRFINDIVVRPTRVTPVNIRLAETAFSGAEVVVSSGFFERRNDQPVSTVSFNPEEIRRAPGGGQEVLRIVNLLPSVVSVGDTRQDILVRGGSNLENSYFVDNIPMPGIQHFRQQNGRTNGPIGIINTDLVADLEFQGGGFGATFGDAMSSVTNVTYREGSRNGLVGDVYLSLAGAGATVEHGLFNGNGSLMISGRRSYLDLIADAINTGGAPRYSDLQGKLVFDLNPSNRLSIINIYGDSQFVSTRDNALDEDSDNYGKSEFWQNTSGANLRTIWNSGVYTNTSLSWSTTGTDVQIKRLFPTNSPGTFDESVDFVMDYQDHLFALRSVSYAQLNTAVGVEFGTDLRYEMNDYSYFIAAGFDRAGEPLDAINQTLEIDGFRGAVFASLRLRPLNRLTINTGLRAEYSDYNGETDLLPRIAARYDLTSKLSLNAAIGVYSQVNPRFILSQSPSNQKLSNPKTTHYIAGIEYLLTPETLFSVEVYNKEYSRMAQLPANTENGDPSWVFDNAGAFVSDLVAEGKGWARGVELLLQKKMAQGFYGTVSASFFRTRYEDYQGVMRNRDFDVRYLFAVNGGYRPSDKWEFSARWSWQGAGPRTPFDQEASQNANRGIFDLSQFNTLRSDDFHALYVRADRRFFFRKTNLITYVEIWNAYNNVNTDSYEWSGIIQNETRVTQFSILPVGGIRFEF